MIKAVLFDLDDTLYDTSRQVDLARKKAVQAMIEAGLKKDPEDALTALAKVVAEKGPNYQRHYDDMLVQLGHQPDPKIIAAGIIAYHEAKRKYLVPYPDAIPTLAKLKGLKIMLGVVTDGVPVKQWEKIIRLGFKDLFDAVVVAEEGRGKPSPQPYLTAADELRLAPGVCLAVGDRVDRDVVAAKKAGMASAQIVRGRHSTTKPGSEEEMPDYVITTLESIVELVYSTT